MLPVQTAWASFLGELLQFMTVIKVTVAVSIVVLLSLVAELVSPRAAGVLSGYPLGAAIVLFFVGIEVGPAFAAASATYTMVGLGGTVSFAYTYYLCSKHYRKSGKKKQVLAAAGISVAVYMVVAMILSRVKANTITAVLIGSFSIIVGSVLLKEVKDTRIEKRVHLTLKVILLRATVASVVILIITIMAKYIGSSFTGVFSAFPITMLPFIAIIHYTYDSTHVRSIIKNIPRGLFSLLIYSLCVTLSYPPLGVYFGTLIAYAFATGYLLLLYFDLPAGLLRLLKSSPGKG
ncbi:MAG: hypothetical protein JRI89_12950 [Deltaproteobacteria bacterium]|nr:hypothetical protein [Deltaproteobacteria bacterium]